jgi:hypothetical protein
MNYYLENWRQLLWGLDLAKTQLAGMKPSPEKIQIARRLKIAERVNELLSGRDPYKVKSRELRDLIRRATAEVG